MKNVPELTDLDKQIILYAKGWYGRDKGILEDIALIFSINCAIPVKDVGKIRSTMQF